MNRRRTVLFAAWLALAIGAGVLVRFVHEQQRRQSTLEQQSRDLQQQLRAERERAEAAQRQLAQAERELAALPAPRAEVGGDPAAGRVAQQRAWLARVKRLRQLFVEQPDQRVPEMALLDDADWLRIARTAAFDTPEQTREALAAIRAAATAHFMTRLQAALKLYLKSTDRTMPAALLALTPYFESGVDPAMLERYEAVKSEGPPLRSRVGWIVRARDAIDPEYDTRNFLDPTGGRASTAGPSAWIPDFWGREAAAEKVFRAAHDGNAPASYTETLPYFDPPLPPSVVSRLNALQRASPF